jgi:hypothetical protein
MTTLKDQFLWLVHKNAAIKAANLAGEYARPKTDEKDAILAGLPPRAHRPIWSRL